MKHVRSSLLVTLLGVSLVATQVQASAVFPDVPDNHPLKNHIEELVRIGVINGNPDGTFAPEENVNRAAMMKMLYEATGKTPDPLSVRCFPDVVIGSWYEPYVCDAAARRYVNGYPNGMFGPDLPIKKVEAMKMIANVFDIPLQDVTNENRDIVNFADISLSAWYTQYVLTAYMTGILPIPGEQGARFYPDKEITRAEAAAYIYNALNADYTLSKGSQHSSRSARSVASSPTSVAQSSSVAVEDGTTTGQIDVSIPFTKEGKFKDKDPTSYLFTLTSAKTLRVETSLQSGQPGQLSCRLYLLNDSGFSSEYFLGYQEGGSCYINASLNPGNYQLQLQPTQAGTTYTVSAVVGSGDGNDGFRDAQRISVNKQLSGILTAGDYQDWFTFSLLSQQKMTVEIDKPTELRCIVYSMDDVDLQSFTGPQCNSLYTYPSGTYYIAIGRKAPKASQQSYTLDLKK